MSENTPFLLPLSSSLSTTPQRRVTFKQSPEKARHPNHRHQYHPPTPHRHRPHNHRRPHHHHHRPHHRHHPPLTHSTSHKCRPLKRAVLSELPSNIPSQHQCKPRITLTQKRSTPPYSPTPNPPPSPLPCNLAKLHNRRLHLTHYGAKAHLQRTVEHSLNLSPCMREYYAGMLQALPAAQLHALYAHGRPLTPGLALLRQAELEESELAKIETEMRKGLGHWAVIRVRADERRQWRMARGLLNEFVQREEGGLQGKGDGDAVGEGVLALAKRVSRMKSAEESRVRGDAERYGGYKACVRHGTRQDWEPVSERSVV